jgi:hypothetical protein
MIQQAAIIRQIASSHRDQLGLKMPAAFETAEKNLAQLGNAATKLQATPGKLAAAVAAAILKGADPAADPEVARLVIAERLGEQGTINAVSGHAEAQLVQALSDNVAPMIEQWRAVFDKQATALTKAAKVLGDVDLELDANQILNRGGDVAQHWTAARDANHAIKNIQGVWSLLATVTRFAAVSPEWRIMIVTAPTLTQWEDQNLRGAKMSPFEMLKAGLTLDLAEASGYRERMTALQTQRELREYNWKESQKVGYTNR